MQKILALVLSIIMAITALIPGLGGNQVQGVTTGDWLTMLNDQFGMTTYVSQDPYYADIDASNPYFEAVQIAYEWGVITDADVIDVDANVTNEFVAMTLVRVALLEVNKPAPIKNASKLAAPEEVAVAAALGLVKLESNGRFRVKIMSLADALAALAKARELWANKTFGDAEIAADAGNGVKDLSAKVSAYTVDEAANTVTLAAAQAAGLKAGDIYILPQTAENPSGAAFKVAAVQTVGGQAVITNEEVALDEVYDEVSFAGDFAPQLAAAKIVAGDGTVLQDATVATGNGTSQFDFGSLLQKIDVDFSLGNFDFGLKVTDTGFNLEIGSQIVNGVNLKKTYEVSNLNVSTKLDANLLTNNIKEAYIRADYDLKDITTLTGSYAASVAVDQPAGAEPIDFMTAAKEGLLKLVEGSGSKIKVFSIDVPIPNLPTVTLSLDVNIRITVYGKIEITITSSQVKGIEIINNKIRVINEAEYGQQTYDIMADVRFTVGLCFAIKALGFIIVDAEFEAGIGIKVSAYIVAETAEYALNIPLDLAIEIPYPTGGMNGAEFCGNAKIYGLMSVSIGQNSKLLKLAGLTKTWVIFDESNAVIYNLHIEENGVVPECTRARTGR